MPPPSQKENFPNLDFLSTLPSEIIANILGRLRIRQAIQTCILSRQWRYKWCSMTRLYFDNDCVTLQDDDDDALFHGLFINFVDRVLLYHQGPVHEFIIDTEAEPNISELNQWVYYAACNNVRELSLKFIRDAMVPSSLFQCSKLMSLNLGYCNIWKLPVSFDGFMSLKTLNFDCVKILTSSLEKLVSCCPILESLKFSASDLKDFSVQAPVLKYLQLEGKGGGVILLRTPLLRELSVTICGPDVVRNDNHIVIKFLDKVPSLEKLIGHSYFMKHWSHGEDPETCAITLGCLRFIDLNLNFKDPAQVLQLLKLMDHSPLLEDIHIRALGQGTPSVVALGSEFWSRARDTGCQLLQLKKVRMAYYHSTHAMEFMKFLLLNAPMLEEMHVDLCHSPRDRKKKVVAELLRCRRASRIAEVVCNGF